jgi:hypothetical protein
VAKVVRERGWKAGCEAPDRKTYHGTNAARWLMNNMGSKRRAEEKPVQTGRPRNRARTGRPRS